jgi:hypothetical protein
VRPSIKYRYAPRCLLGLADARSRSKPKAKVSSVVPMGGSAFALARQTFAVSGSLGSFKGGGGKRERGEGEGYEWLDRGFGEEVMAAVLAAGKPVVQDRWGGKTRLTR